MSRADIIRAQRQVLGCRRCPLAGTNTPLIAPVTPLFTVVGEAPGNREAQRRQPFIGPAGRLLRRALERAGLDADAAAWMNVVSCVPRDETNRIRPPSDEERRACWPNLDAQMRAAPTDWVLVCGATALANWRSDVWISKAHGVPFVRGGKGVMAVLHPAVFLREPRDKWKLDEALGLFAALVTGEGLAGREVVGTHCLWCLDRATVWDDDLWPWCRKHGPKELTEKQRVRRRTKARTAANKRKQEAMF